MRNVILHSFIALLVICGGASAAYAQTADIQATTSVNAEVNRKDPERKPFAPGILPAIKARVEEKIKTDMKSASTTQDNKGSLVKRAVKNEFEKMIARMKATIEREESIMARIVSRIEKVKAAGGKAEVSEKFVAEAKVQLEKARVSLSSLRSTAEITALLKAEGTSTTTRASLKDSLSSLKKAANETEGYIKAAHNALVRATASLKGVSSTKPEIRATSTTNIQN